MWLCQGSIFIYIDDKCPTVQINQVKVSNVVDGRIQSDVYENYYQQNQNISHAPETVLSVSGDVFSWCQKYHGFPQSIAYY